MLMIFCRFRNEECRQSKYFSYTCFVNLFLILNYIWNLYFFVNHLIELNVSYFTVGDKSPSPFLHSRAEGKRIRTFVLYCACCLLINNVIVLYISAEIFKFTIVLEIRDLLNLENLCLSYDRARTYSWSLSISYDQSRDYQTKWIVVYNDLLILILSKCFFERSSKINRDIFVNAIASSSRHIWRNELAKWWREAMKQIVEWNSFVVFENLINHLAKQLIVKIDISASTWTNA
jgi:hypothetical protein